MTTQIISVPMVARGKKSMTLSWLDRALIYFTQHPYYHKPVKQLSGAEIMISSTDIDPNDKETTRAIARLKFKDVALDNQSIHVIHTTRIIIILCPDSLHRHQLTRAASLSLHRKMEESTGFQNLTRSIKDNIPAVPDEVAYTIYRSARTLVDSSGLDWSIF